LIRQNYEALYARHAREIWAVAYARTRDADLATDLMQESFLRLWKHAGEELDNPRAWLVRVARNLAEDAAKSAFRRNGTAAPEQLAGLRGREIETPEALVRAETFARVRELLDELTPADREVLTLKYGFDYDAAEIAAALGIHADAVYMRLSRARQRLGELLKAHGVSAEP
jgi:RNA polymerase sigma-70 factor, ECF subfamily